MAQQHFYARVPARASMFNKADGYDTFACSENVTRDFAEKDLLPICDLKFQPGDLDAVRDGKMGPIYARFLLKNGETAVSAISFLPKDYSGERPAYMVHTLIQSPEETEAQNGDRLAALVNPSWFLKDPSFFRLTDPETRPNREYPVFSGSAEPVEDPVWLAETYGADTLRRFLYALLAAFSGKIKGVLVTLDGIGEETAEKTVRLFNAIGAILPPYLRAAYTYATRTLSSAQFPSMRLRGIVGEVQGIQAPRYAIFNLGTGQFSGIVDKDVADQMQTVDFFYSLIKNPENRRAFFDFCNFAVRQAPSLGGLSLKEIGDLVFMFRASSRAFAHGTVMPNDDRVLDMLSLYEKMREAIGIEERIYLMRVFSRYSEAHCEIPKKIFAKMTKLYPSEPIATKHVIMNECLEVLHDDAMRSKVFTFIKSVFDDEDAETQSIIIHHFASIYYGGFLQPQILAFFVHAYSGAAPASKEEMLDKVLLTIRTKAILSQTVEFLNAAYADLDAAAKEKVYREILEQLPEGDTLAHSLLAFADAHLAEEPDEIREPFFAKVISDLEKEQRRAEHPMLRMFEKTDGCCETAVARKILSDWSGRKIFAEYLAGILTGNFPAKTDVLKKISELDVDFTEEITELLLREALAIFEKDAARTLISEVLSSAKTFEESENALAAKIPEAVLHPLLSSMLTDVFGKRSGGVTVEELVSYAESVPALTEAKGFSLLNDYLAFKNAAISGDLSSMIRIAETFPKEKRLREDLAEYAKKDLRGARQTAVSASKDLTASEKTDSESADTLELRMLLSYVKTAKSLSVDGVLRDGVRDYGETLPPKNRPTGAALMKASGCVQKVMNFVSLVESTAETEELKAAVRSEDGGLPVMIRTFMREQNGKCEKIFLDAAAALSDKELADLVRSVVKEAKPKGSLLSGILGMFRK